MDLRLHKRFAHDGNAAQAVKLIEKCVHCGFCATACPTYSLDGNELDSPRGRIYLVKQLLEDDGGHATAHNHLDLCLTCKSCETACPSGVEYGRIAHFGRVLLERRAPRGMADRLVRRMLSETLRSRRLTSLIRKMAHLAGPLTPKFIEKMLPRPAAGTLAGWPKPRHSEKAALLLGCCQAGLMPQTNVALARLLDAAGVSALPVSAPCCGALRDHLGRHEPALADIAAVVGESMALLDSGASHIFVAASGCAAFVRDYPHLLAGGRLAEQGKRVADALKDPADFLADRLELLGPVIGKMGDNRRAVVHTPCTRRNGMRAGDGPVRLLRAAGFAIAEAGEQPNCCGSAGTYSVLNKRISGRLRDEMLARIDVCGADLIVSANIGCVLHLGAAARTPVQHWADTLDPATG